MIRLPPNEMLQRAVQALNNGQLPFAEEACRSVLRVQPERGEAWLWLARIVMEASRFDEAEELLGKAEKFGANTIDITIARSSLRWREGRDQESHELCRKVLSMRPGDTESLMRMAACERRMGDPKQSLRRLGTMKSDPGVAVLAAWAHLDLKDPGAALAAVAPFASLSALSGTQRTSIFHVMGFAQEKLGQYAEAVASYTRSKEAFPLRLEESTLRRTFTELRDFFTSEFLRGAPRAAVRTERPVFIAAMPRSGTTLLDRIIGSHPQAAGAGETRALRRQIAEWSGPTPDLAWPRVASTLTTESLDRVVTRYLKETDQYGRSALRTADKHLMNWLFIGLIDMAFPESRIIHIRRDPIDAGISCFERLRTNAVAWAGSLRSIGIALRACDVLIEHWKSACRVPILCVEYESLVRHQEAETRRIIDFLGLPWDDACLEFHAKERGQAKGGGILPPPTLSSEQAAQPMYDSSIGRGARFGAALDPLRQAYAEPL